jgi:hypothetical protein
LRNLCLCVTHPCCAGVQVVAVPCERRVGQQSRPESRGDGSSFLYAS